MDSPNLDPRSLPVLIAYEPHLLARDSTRGSAARAARWGAAPGGNPEKMLLPWLTSVVLRCIRLQGGGRPSGGSGVLMMTFEWTTEATPTAGGM